MKKLLVASILFVCFAFELSAHDTFLRLTTHYVKPKNKVSVTLMNGTFESSENSVALERLRDVRITGPNDFVERPENGQWTLTEKLNRLEFTSGESGTYIVGVSIKPRTLEMTAEKFDDYLEHDGVLDILKERKTGKASDAAVKERYSKHVKALFQVGDERTDSFGKVFGFPIEIIPQKNPFSLKAGDTLPVKILLRGEPATNQLVYASFGGFHQHDEQGNHVEAIKTRTNSKGIAEIKIEKKGLWYIRLIHMEPSDDEGVDYESNWATLTFEIK